ncbi:MAG: AIR synthase family protein [Firmicutes bacterium]|nr:AIR synthase family protein [Candidatus Fermentithermobacillaceae bacterium]
MPVDTSERLSTGKIGTTLLRNIVFRRTGALRAEMIVPPSIGEDSTVLDMGSELVVASIDPITGASRKQGWLGVKVALNDVAAKGAEPVAVLVTILLPEGARLEDLEGLVDEIHQACLEENVTVAGGHTEVTPGLQHPILAVVAIGKTKGKRILRSSGARPGDDIVVTKWAGLEGTAVLLMDFPGQLARLLPDPANDEKSLVAEGEKLFAMVSVTRDGMIAAANGATACHDVTEGGVLGAVYELCEASGSGVIVDAKAIPVLPITSQVASVTGIDPLKLTSSGCLIVTHPDGDSLVKAYRENGINAAVIGKIIADARRVVLRESGEEALDPPGTDHLWLARSFLSGK